MTVEHFEQTLRGNLSRRPFKPFEIEMMSGRRFPVTRPKMLFYPLGGELAVYFSDRDTLDFVDYRAVREIRNLQESPEPLKLAPSMPLDAFERALQTRLQRQPFQPFVVESISGRRFKVLNPKMLMYPGGEGPSAMFFWDDGNMDIVDCDGVAKIEDLNESAAA